MVVMQANTVYTGTQIFYIKIYLSHDEETKKPLLNAMKRLLIKKNGSLHHHEILYVGGDSLLGIPLPVLFFGAFLLFIVSLYSHRFILWDEV